MNKLILRPKEDRRLRQGHLWVFANEVDRHPQAEPGDLVEVITARGDSLGAALYHPHSLISARLLAADLEDLDRDFFADRLAAAARLRERLFPDETCYRLVFGESDWLPGLVVDKFGDFLVVQTTSAGMDRRLPLIAQCLGEIFHPAAIMERNDTPLRLYEELPERTSVLAGVDPGPVIVEENGLRYRVDLAHGQKTGFFLDQKLNRQAVARYCRGQRVLDCFSNAGGFALHAARAGAREVTGFDSSDAAVRQATENAQLNQLPTARFTTADAFTFLEEAARAGERWDVIVLDPPSFTRSRKNVTTAKKGYRRLNELALRVLSEEGILATASCSFHIFEEAFYEIVGEAAIRADRRLRLLERRRQAPDHPILPAMPETQYLKLGILQAI
jgi:23S rRNA (cytosine1962-C5)-methyltransferase